MSMFWNAGRLAEPGHALHVAAEHDDEPGAGAGQHAAHRQDEVRRAIAQQRVVREREVGLGHAHRRGAHAQLLDALQVLHRLHLQVDAPTRRRAASRSLRSASRSACPRASGTRTCSAWRTPSPPPRPAPPLPAPPLPNPLCATTVSAPALVASSRTSAISAGVSVGKLLMATTQGRPYCRTI